MTTEPAHPPTPMDVLRAALRKEEAAYRFYASALDTTKVELVRELFTLLRDEEGKHVRMVKERIAKLSLG